MEEIHNLKTWPEYFAPIWVGQKAFEYRQNDRGFKVGHTLVLWEWDKNHKAYTGAYVLARVDYILEGPDMGVPEGMCIMSISPWCQGQGQGEQVALWGCYKPEHVSLEGGGA